MFIGSGKPNSKKSQTYPSRIGDHRLARLAYKARPSLNKILRSYFFSFLIFASYETN